MGATDTTTPARVVTLRLNPTLEQQLQALADRDSNSISATARRLLMAGLRTERRSVSGDEAA